MENKRDSFFLPKKAEKKNKKQEDMQQLKKENRNKKFDENRSDLSKPPESKEKKPFDKKVYRLKKYSKKYKLDQWEENRKKMVMQKYYKDIKNDPLAGTYKPFNFDNVDGQENVGKYVRHPDSMSNENQEPNTKSTSENNNLKKDPFWKAKQKLQQIKQEKLNKQQERERAKEEQNKKLLEYKKKKQERFKKLCKKTKKGQPVMTGRLELLLEKIQNNRK